MTNPLSVDDLFTVGISFDLLGGYMLGRGLLASPTDIRMRSATVIGANPAAMLSQIAARADGEMGLLSLAIGFLLQGAGYVCLIAGVTLTTGIWRAVLSVGLAAVAFLVALLIFRRMHRGRVRRLAVAVARVDPETGQEAELPSGQLLVAIGQQLGHPYQSGSIEGVPSDVDAYAKRHFGAERTSLP